MTDDQLRALRDFAREIIRMGVWDAAIDGADVQTAAEKHGLIVPTKYDPEKHGEVDADPGDEIFELADWLKLASRPMQHYRMREISCGSASLHTAGARHGDEDGNGRSPEKRDVECASRG